MKVFTTVLVGCIFATVTSGCIKWQNGTVGRGSHGASRATADNTTEKKSLWVSIEAYTPQAKGNYCNEKREDGYLPVRKEKDYFECKADATFKALNGKEENYARTALLNAINESGSFTLASSEDEADYSLVVRVTRYNPSRGLVIYTAVVGVLTLTAIPTYNKLYYDYDIKLFSKNTQETKKREIQQKHHVLAWLPLIVATPFVLPFNTQKKLMERVSGEIVAWCDEQKQQDDKNPGAREETAVTPAAEEKPQVDTEMQLPQSSEQVLETTNEPTPAAAGESDGTADPAAEKPGTEESN